MPALATPADHALAERAARAAGELLVALRRELAGTMPGRKLGQEGDRRAHELITSMLAAEAPADPVLSEEGADPEARAASERVWIVDPLDGTREFSEPSRVDWAVHLALAIHGEPAAGAVALPARGLVLSTAEPPAPPPAPTGARPPRLVVSRSRPPAEAELIRQALGAVVAPLGSAGAKAMAVVLGDADIYAHAGGQHEWDNAAPAAVALAAGLHVSRLDGAPLIYNQPVPWLPDLLICRRELAAPVIEALRAA